MGLSLGEDSSEFQTLLNGSFLNGKWRNVMECLVIGSLRSLKSFTAHWGSSSKAVHWKSVHWSFRVDLTFDKSLFKRSQFESLKEMRLSEGSLRTHPALDSYTVYQTNFAGTLASNIAYNLHPALSIGWVHFPLSWEHRLDSRWQVNFALRTSESEVLTEALELLQNPLSIFNMNPKSKAPRKSL